MTTIARVCRALLFLSVFTGTASCATGTEGDVLVLVDGGSDAPTKPLGDAARVDSPSSDVVTYDSLFDEPPPVPMDGPCASPEVLCSGHCVNTLTDKANCGGCGITCVATCIGGCCLDELIVAPKTPYGTDQLAAIAVDSTTVYVANTGTPDGLIVEPGSLLSVPIGGGTVSTLYSSWVDSFVLTSSDVYFLPLSTTTNTIERMPLTGGTPTTLVSVSAILDAGVTEGWGRLVLDSTSMYVGTSAQDCGYPITNTIVTTPLAGGTPSTLLSMVETGPESPSLGQFQVLSNDLYWVQTEVGGDGGVQAEMVSRPISGGTATTLASAPGFNYSNVLFDSHGIYWATTDGAIVTVGLSGGTPTTLATGFKEVSLGATDGTDVYFVAERGLLSIPIGGGTVSTLAKASCLPGAIADVAYDSTSLYFTTSGTASAAYKLTPK